MNISANIKMNENSESSVKAFASIAVGGCFAVKCLRVIDGEKGLFVSMPCSKGKDGKYYDYTYPLTAELREQISNAVLKEYENPKGEQAKENTIEENLDIQFKLSPTEKLGANVKAVGTMTINNEFVVTGIKIVDGEKGLFVTMPSVKAKDGNYISIANPITAEFRKKVNEGALKAYANLATSKTQETKPQNKPQGAKGR